MANQYTSRTQAHNELGRALVALAGKMDLEAVSERKPNCVELWLRPKDGSVMTMGHAMVLRDLILEGGAARVPGRPWQPTYDRPWPGIRRFRRHLGRYPDYTTQVIIAIAGKGPRTDDEAAIAEFDEHARRNALVLTAWLPPGVTPGPTRNTDEERAMRHVYDVLCALDGGEAVATEPYVRGLMARPCNLSSGGTLRCLYRTSHWVGVLWTYRVAGSKECKTPDGRWVRKGTGVWSLAPDHAAVAARWGWR